MNFKYLTQALRYAFLPTMIVLFLLCLGFFSINNAVNFLISNNGLAITVRLFLAIAELTLIYFLYRYYEKKGIINSGVPTNENNKTHVSSYTHIRDIKEGWKAADTYYWYPTANPNVIVIERKTD